MKVNIRERFPKALGTGKPFVVQSFMKDSKTAPVAVQFAQQIIRDNDNPVLSLQLGGNMGTIITTIKNFTLEQAKKLGLNNGEERKIFSDDNVIFVETISPMSLEIAVVENTTKNEKLRSQQPKVNPVTGEILTYNKQPIYVHTDLVVKEKVVRHFLQPDQQNNASTNVIVEAQRLKGLIS